ncbi:hypothetical protein CMU93_02740 [Elizabethkingia anophelis]|nr:hypothetical protein [Elizabethkingia anophelis]
MKKSIVVVYYVLVVFIAFSFITSGYYEITKSPEVFSKSVNEMGYPPYFIVSLGYLKLLGCATLLISIAIKNKWFIRFGEWVLVCFLSDVVFAFISEVNISSQAGTVKTIVVFIILLVTLLLHLCKKEESSKKTKAVI